MPQPQRLVAEPAVYTVPEDLTPERQTAVLLALTEWFSKSRSTREPAAVARQELDFCMRGVTKAGKPWKGMERATLAARVRSMCRFDLEKMEPLLNASDAQRKKKEREKELRRRKDARGMNALIPDELRAEMKRGFRAGDNPAVYLSSAEEAEWRKFKEDTLRDYPHLNNTTSLKLLDQLADLVMISERQRVGFLSGKEKVDYEDRAAVTQQIDRLMKILGIHSEQLIKRKDDKKDTSISAAALRMSQLGDYRKLRLRFWAEELLQIYAMFMQPSADGLTYQLDDVGLYGLTKTRVVCCPKCKTRNWAGLSIDEIEAWLVKSGLLKKVGEGYPTYQPSASSVIELVDAHEQAEAAQEEADARSQADSDAS